MTKQERQTFIFFLIDKFPVSLLIFSHETTHTLFFNKFLFLLLFPFRINMVENDSFIKAYNFSLVIFVVFSKIFSMLYYGSQEFLSK